MSDGEKEGGWRGKEKGGGGCVRGTERREGRKFCSATAIDKSDWSDGRVRISAGRG